VRDSTAENSLDIDAHLRAGAALYTTGRFHAAHDPWEAAWLAARDIRGEQELGQTGLTENSQSPTDERSRAEHTEIIRGQSNVQAVSQPDANLFQGLVQTTAALHHTTTGNTKGATGLAKSAVDYLADVPDGHRSVGLVPIHEFLTELASDIAVAATPPPLRVEGHEWTLADLELPSAGPAAVALAEAEGFDESVVERAIEFSWADLANSPTSPFADAIYAFVADSGAPRAVSYDRLRVRTERRQAKMDDVSGLFGTDSASDSSEH
jgi:predicted metal-dependent hydrolase